MAFLGWLGQVRGSGAWSGERWWRETEPELGLRLGDAAGGTRVPVPSAESDGGGRAEGPGSGRRLVPGRHPSP